MSFFNRMFGGGMDDVNYKELVQNGAVLIDVRTPGEFAQGHVDNAINIPLQVIGQEVAKIKAFNKPVIVYCLSGARAGSAKSFLEGQGIETYNGGGIQAMASSLA
ncbi:MAG TPA: rhodanese-like domain-containing protein [Saprospiraceae bacterium]|nr:rhodanese-like domain-containing protein [Saprospiraceae bacterium]